MLLSHLQGANTTESESHTTDMLVCILSKPASGGLESNLCIPLLAKPNILYAWPGVRVPNQPQGRHVPRKLVD